MSGVRVFGLPSKATEKHLKVYFSNPKNGGGHIQKIYHPLPHGSAVVLFNDKRVLEEVLKRSHQLSGKPVELSAIPKQVYRRAVVEIQKNVSDFLSVNPQLVDELQFVEEINVNFQYEKQRYLLDGTWYQIEWALHYLDTMLEAFQFDMDTGFESRRPVGNTLSQVKSADRGSQTEFRDESPPRNQEIKCPNIPVVGRPQQHVDQPFPASTGNQMSDFRKFTGNQSSEMKEILPKANKNKNVMPVTSSTTSESRSIETKLYGTTVRSNLNDERENRYQTGSWNQRGARNFAKDDEDWDTDPVLGAQASYKRTFEGQGDSDSENEASLAAAYDRKVAFTSDTDFTSRGRPARGVPRMTKGIDVSRTDFGEAPLSFTFEILGSLKIHVAMDDITKQTTDTIINPTTPDLTNIYGVSRAILAAAGYEMQIECRRYAEEKGPLQYAGVMHTAAGGNLSQKLGFVIHTAGPSWSEQDSEYCTHLLVCTYINCFQYADQNLWVQSLATPLISAGAFGFPLDVCIGAFYDAVLLFSTRSSTKRHLKEIHLVCFDQDSAMATIMIVQSLLDCDSAQSAVAATDRYWMCSSKYNFQAENYGKADEKKNVSDDEHSDDELQTGLNTVVKQGKTISEGRVDENQVTNLGEDNDADKQTEDSKIINGVLNKPAVQEAVQDQTFTEELKKTDVIDDQDEKEEILNPYVDVKLAEGKPGQRAEMETISKLSMKRVEKDYSDSGESDEGGVEGKSEISNPYVDEKLADGEPGITETGSLNYTKLDLGNVDRDVGLSDDDENSRIQEEDIRKVCEEKESVGDHFSLGNTKTEKEEEDKTDCESRNEEKQAVSERTDKELDFKVSVGKSSLSENSEWSMVPGNDETKAVNISSEHGSEDETGEELYL